VKREQFLLNKLAEECAEVAQRALKQVQYGANQIQKGNEVKDGVAPPSGKAGLSNRQRLTNELVDLAIIYELLEEAGQLAPPPAGFEYDDIKAKKIEKTNKYLSFSRSLGEIDGDWAI
jgi:hypothetical protein